MKRFDSINGDVAAHAFIGRKLVDRYGESVGTLAGFWLDPSTHRVAFLGVKTGWLAGRVHILPAADVEIEEHGSLIALGYTAAHIKRAPIGRPGVELAEVAKEEINAYYGRLVPVQRVSSIQEIRPEETLRTGNSGEDSATADAEVKTSVEDRSKLEKDEQAFFKQKGFVTDSMSEVDATGELARTQEEAKARNREDRDKRGDLD
jgi:PRC-barrel domain protein